MYAWLKQQRGRINNKLLHKKQHSYCWLLRLSVLNSSGSYYASSCVHTTHDEIFLHRVAQHFVWHQWVGADLLHTVGTRTALRRMGKQLLLIALSAETVPTARGQHSVAHNAVAQTTLELLGHRGTARRHRGILLRRTAAAFVRLARKWFLWKKQQMIILLICFHGGEKYMCKTMEETQ